MYAPKISWHAIHLENEKHLLLSIARGDEHAYRELFETYRHAVYSYSMHLLKNEPAADDVVQDVFLKLWINRHKLPEVAYFKGWLLTIVKNKLIDTLRSQVKQRQLFQQVKQEEASLETEKQVIAREYDVLVRRALEHLTPQQQLVYHLSRNQGLRNQEIAVQLNISPNTVKTHLVQALKTIRSFITPHLSAVIPVLMASIKYF